MKIRFLNAWGGIIMYFAIMYFAIVIAIAYGWIANIVTIAHSNFSEITGMLVLRMVGIFVAPLGVVLGYV